MIETLVELLGNFYASNDLTNFEAISRNIHASIPNDLVSLQFLGLAYYRTGRIKDAIQIFDQAVRRKKTARKTDLHETDVLPQCNENSAEVCFLEATRSNPKLSGAWYDLGKAFLDLKRFEPAISAFRSAIIAQPAFAPAILALGQAALHVKDLATAEDGFSRLRKLQPNNDKAYLGLAMVYRKRRDFPTARACFVRARMLLGNLVGIENLKHRRCPD